MPEKLLEFERAKDNWIAEKIRQQNLAYTAIHQYEAGLITYTECQSIVFNSFQRITGKFISEFQAGKFF